jgi:signal transduction histidine kinase
MKKIQLLIAASTLAVLVLIAFQIQWIQHSTDLLDELFEDKVGMALCTTIEQQGGAACCEPVQALFDFLPVSESTCETLQKDTNFRQTLDGVLSFYDIGLEYNLSFTQEKLEDNTENATFSCAVDPIDNSDDEVFVNLSFPDRETFIMEKMKAMMIASFLIILFISSVFLWANYSLWKQKRQAEINTDFYNNMAHEFRTPLTNIGLASKMLSKKHNNLKDNELLKIIQRENSKLVNQIERVLHLSKVENGEYHLQKENLNLQSLFTRVKEEMDMQIQAKAAKFNLRGIDENLAVFGDKLHLGNVFKNLLDNALKYSNDFPKIDVMAQQNGKGVYINFQDNGIGIPKCNQQNIFEKFQRIPSNSTGKNVQNCRGFGLGLSYVKMMIELHKGSIKVHSNGQEGTRFEIFLPTT